MSGPEKLALYQLKQYGLKEGKDFELQKKNLIPGRKFVADIMYKGYIIEIDGGFHQFPNKQWWTDRVRDVYFYINLYEVYRISEKDLKKGKLFVILTEIDNNYTTTLLFYSIYILYLIWLNINLFITYLK